jgi:hypothetical protein
VRSRHRRRQAATEASGPARPRRIGPTIQARMAPATGHRGKVPLPELRTPRASRKKADLPPRKPVC